MVVDVTATIGDIDFMPKNFIGRGYTECKNHYNHYQGDGSYG